MPTPPNVKNYHIGKGIVSFQETGSATYIDLGNAPLFQYTPTVTKLDHFSARQGVKTKDFTAVSQVGATITMRLDEITGYNLGFFALSHVDEATVGNVILGGLTKTLFTGSIKVVGTNDVGTHIDFTANVSFVPAGNFQFITDADAFSVLEIQAEVQKDAAGNFGIWTVHDTV
jgi:hypothetical protein